MDAQILAMVAPQVQPLHNPYDDAAFYFGDTEMDVELAVPTETMGKDERASDCNALDAVPSTSTAPVNEKAGPKTLKKKCIDRGSIKELYFKTKLHTARLEKKYLINREKRDYNRYIMEHNKHKIEMEILLLRKKRLQGRP
ncbi:uncharacterized protein LOC124540303 isoform X2 [Vanessa cardui]|uniref:uncharacterized protein LOC124540303 isoform X2 n=1 Tax=Vanessa cardui TaxID=171605 RepID=UPI001F141B10|nr:uncharacterized protein LOC124540303 isoform X2 [Vanessa cardui]